MNKVFESTSDAVADIKDGASIAIAGFGVGHSYPNSLVLALQAQGAKNLAIIANSLGAGGDFRPQILVQNGQVSRLVLSFSVRPGMPSPEEEKIAAGEIALEMVPQGILVERLRAAGAGLPAFYSPVTVGTPLQDGKEVRRFGERDYVLEHALPVDVALIRGYRADRFGNVEFRGSSAHFHASFARAAKMTIVEVEHIVEAGEILPERVGLPGIFVSRVVQTVAKYPAPAGRMGRRAPESGREYFGKPALTRTNMAKRAAALLPEGAYVNLGSGLPTLVAAHTQDKSIFLHAENGALGYDLLQDPAQFDVDFFDAAGNFIKMRPGGALFDSVASFEIARSGKLSAILLGAYQVSEKGDLANWAVPGQSGGGIGGAMDLASSGSKVIVLMEHCDGKGKPKFVRECSYPLTALACVDTVVTDLALLVRQGNGFEVTAIAEGFTPDEIRALTPIDITFAQSLEAM
ncbi:succinyl-CoA--3-ketoacid-CoA transferase (plasmid) [Agrobacterium vitis]|uniref:3-oxoacid CoA-transferase n=1 Tax=Agrobacterium vitis TaxID=373 RepID=UPI0015D97B49|nr:3-oxoacid CoA-transferase subunit A [Agrobacterium vitis]BCH67209.1 succinyl-CoA--3-ketoacid-CoA transferase [Agrobacterium vitis]